MKPVENWKSVLLRSWSVWIFAAISLVSAFQGAIVYFAPIDLGLTPRDYDLAVLVLGILGVFARIIRQDFIAFLRDEGGRVRRSALGGIAAVSIAASVAFVAPWEGLRTSAYQDLVGVWTVCFGETKGVKPGDAYTVDECDAMLREELLDYAVDLGKCLDVKVPEGVAVAWLSWSYNVGTRAACRSTLMRKANAGDLFGACDELLRWNRAGGRVVRGLTNRRQSEHALCTSSLISAGYSRAVIN